MGERRPTQVGREVEAALIAASDDAGGLARRLAALRELNGYLLSPRPEERIADDYLDTADARLGTKRVALRVRLLDGAARLTLKGPTERRGVATSRRLELEQPWSAAAAGRALRALANLDIRLARRTASRAWRNPEDFVSALGLVHVQRRETLRKPRDVRDRGGASDAPLAELALDTVSYRIGRRKVRLFEVEIEAKRKEGVAAASRVAGLLIERWGGGLRAWKHSKLATGLALDALERDGKLAALLSPAGWLTPKGIDLLARRLARESS
jgi:inorganic triphosphatase YgiF